MQKFKLGPETKTLLDGLIHNSPRVPIIEMVNGVQRFQMLRLKVTPSEALRRGERVPKDLLNKRFLWLNKTVHYDLRSLLMGAYKHGGKEAVIEAYNEYLVNFEKAGKLALSLTTKKNHHPSDESGSVGSQGTV